MGNGALGTFMIELSWGQMVFILVIGAFLAYVIGAKALAWRDGIQTAIDAASRRVQGAEGERKSMWEAIGSLRGCADKAAKVALEVGQEVERRLGHEKQRGRLEDRVSAIEALLARRSGEDIGECPHRVERGGVAFGPNHRGA